MTLRPRLAALSSLSSLTLVWGWAWIAAGTRPYFDPDALHPFVVAKMPASLDGVWQAALYVHLITALTSLPACLLLLSATLRDRAPAVHRGLGRATGAVVLLGLVPSGLVLAPTATGGALSAAGFMLSAMITAVAMGVGIAAARRGAFAEHRRAMWHVIGQMSVAVSSRAMLVAAGALELDFERAYIASLWIPVLGTAWAIEVVARPRSSAPPAPLGALARSAALLVPLWMGVSAGARAAPVEDLPAWIQRVFLEPLAAQEAKVSRFSRTPPPPRARQVRLLQSEPSADAAGGVFYAFAVDARWSSDPDEAWVPYMTGCVYPASGAVFIDQGGTFVASAMLLGRRGPVAPATACRATTVDG